MALGTLGQEALNSLTGKIEMAYLIIKDFRTAAGSTSSSSPALTAFDEQIAQRSAGTVLSQRTQSAIEQQRQRLSGGTQSGARQAEEKKFCVQFNPSELQIYSSNLPVMEANATSVGPMSIANATCKPKVSMTVNLYFDAMNIADSFMWDKYAAGVSAQSAVNIATAVAKGKGKVWSVQPQVEGLIAALRNRQTRSVAFHWSDFCFEGQLIAVMAQYTMFSTSGRPVRARVTLRLQQELDPANLGQWYTDFESAFGASANQTTRVGQSFGSLLNVGF